MGHRGCVLVLACGAAWSAFGQSDPWAAPASYYAGVSGEGVVLRSTLQSAITTGHIQRAYGDFRSSAALHDRDPDVPGNILLAYNRQSVRAQWDSGATWNREHVWPQSRQPGSASNSTRGNLGDPHALRPCNPSVNSSRSNKPFGLDTTTGIGRSLGTYWFPGDEDKGDIARSLFYSSVRYGLSLVDNVPSGNTMGDLGSLVAWHYLDTPDGFERRRNHVIYSQAENPLYYTNNRNAFVDLPGAVWSVFVDGANDSQLWLGVAPDDDGGSSVVVDLGGVIAGAPLPTGFVLLSRGGFDGVYFAVTTEGAAVTDQSLTNGFTGAFGLGEGGLVPIEVGIDPVIASLPGSYEGVVTVDNLDMTTGGGQGRGGNDADDLALVSLDVYEPTSASFGDGSMSLLFNAGRVELGDSFTISLPVVVGSGPLSAPAEIVEVSASGDVALIDALPPAGEVAFGDASSIDVVVDGLGTGSYSASFEYLVSDASAVVGASARGTLELTVFVEVVDDACPADVNGDGVLTGADFNAFLSGFSLGLPSADINRDGVLTGADFNAFLVGFQGGCD